MAFDRQTEDGVGFWAKAAAAKNLRGIESSPGSIGASTTAPDLVSVSDVIGRSRFDYTFDGPVTEVALDKFVVYAADGTPLPRQGLRPPVGRRGAHRHPRDPQVLGQHGARIR